MSLSLSPSKDVGAQILTSSVLATTHSPWLTAPAYKHSDLSMLPSNFTSVTDALLGNPNLNSTHLFRADILYDSAGLLQTPTEKEQSLGSCHTPRENRSLPRHDNDDCMTARQPLESENMDLKRTVVRRLIPRKPQLDRALDQTCHIYTSKHSNADDNSRDWHLVVYIPHVDKEEDMPWYHPPIKALAYLYDRPGSWEHDHDEARSASLDIHILPFSGLQRVLPRRLHRTLLSLLSTYIRLARNTSDSTAPSTIPNSLAPGVLKDSIIPQHLVQNTYTRLKQTYATDLINRWVEKTEPSKHVFEDLSLVAFLIELWKQMYSVLPLSERAQEEKNHEFPGFVDLACGNGVLVYILLQEGYDGFGFDARRRRTWSIFPENTQERLEEKILVPQPFLEVLEDQQDALSTIKNYHNGLFHRNTFIISNHADELTPWTPILAALSYPQDPLPFLAIPCCSHALSGARHRYSPSKSQSHRTPGGSAEKSTIKDPTSGDLNASSTSPHAHRENPEKAIEEQSASGDLRTLRAAKASTLQGADRKSMYGCLTTKIVALAEEIGYDVEKTLMRIPSTRNIGLVGNRKRVAFGCREHWQKQHHVAADAGNGTASAHEDVTSRIHELLGRECRVSGGLEPAAKLWLERARSLHVGKGRGKVNEKAHLHH